MRYPLKIYLQKYLYHSLSKFLMITVGILLISFFAWKSLLSTNPKDSTENTMLKPVRNSAEPILLNNSPPSSPDLISNKALPIEKEKSQVYQESKLDTDLKIDLSLLGTSIQDNNSAYAVIRDNISGKEDLFRKGENIQNAVLAEINNNSVLLRMGSSEQVLYLKETRSDDQAMGHDINQKPPYSPEEISQRYNYEEDVKEVMGLMDQIDFFPSKDNKGINGVIITRIQHDSVFEKIGLQVDDMIISIDEKKIESVDDSFEIYESLRTSLKGSILIKRNNHQETLFYQNEYL